MTLAYNILLLTRCELPYMVDQLTEGWRLPSILTAISQIAQIGPFLYMSFKLIFPNKFKLVRVIYCILSIGAISCLLLSLFWNKTAVVLHEKRSIYLYIFNFSLSLLGIYVIFNHLSLTYLK